MKNKSKKIYFLNRYDLFNTESFREFSGYEQVVKYSEQFEQVKTNNFLQNCLKKSFFKQFPRDYLFKNISKEILVFIKVIFSNRPVFYLYADKDAFLLPLLKRKLGLKRIKIYGTLHWPPKKSNELSFYKHHLINEFNGVIGLSTSISQTLDSNKVKIIPHGIDLNYWQRNDTIEVENLYLIIGISNRDHQKQKFILELIKQIDPKARFLLIARDKKIQNMYGDIKDIEIKREVVSDLELKQFYEKAKAVILFQHDCLASNVVLESIAMCVPVLTNLVGDINEYLGDDYPLYVTKGHEEKVLSQFCSSDALHNEVANYFKNIRSRFDWARITKDTIDFIEQ
ncbi:hypothetical protein [Xanthomarina gelatinilytica]|uniref:hypothetical protein n=1 Tax=Xanthomarina gelatinilytica TaxID=1137281 RepID=UPI003AA7FD0C